MQDAEKAVRSKYVHIVQVYVEKHFKNQWSLLLTGQCNHVFSIRVLCLVQSRRLILNYIKDEL